MGFCRIGRVWMATTCTTVSLAGTALGVEGLTPFQNATELDCFSFHDTTEN